MNARKVLTERSVLHCAHMGTVSLNPSQQWVRVNGASVLVDPDTVNRPVVACPMATLVNTPCTQTMTADRDASFSSLVRIDSRGVCLDTATGVTNWSQLLNTPYTVTSPAQDFVATE